MDAIKKQFEFEAETEEEKNDWIKLLSQNIDGEFDPLHIKPSFDDVDGELIWNVRAELSADQTTIFDDFKAKVFAIPNISEYIVKWLTDDCLYRFLRFFIFLFFFLNYFTFIIFNYLCGKNFLRIIIIFNNNFKFQIVLIFLFKTKIIK